MDSGGGAHAFVGYGYSGNYYKVRDTWTNDGYSDGGTRFLYNSGTYSYRVITIMPSATTWRTVTLQLNSTGVDVKRLKTILYDLWYAPGTINTTFDSTLDSAVRSFQSDWGLSVDGIVGTNTYNMLLQVHSFSSSSPRMLQSGKKGDDVAEMQARLRAYAAAVGNPLIAADGEFGTATTNSLKLFQAYSGLSQDGVCGNNTYNALRNTSFPGNFTV